ncbi:MAG: hypothetical protein KGJ28_05515 [Alphaproteobacteria bacterium]|nr:hypothetical protein [Alphaproteobacteria bacterium]
MGMFTQIWRGLERTAAVLNARWGKPALHVFRWGIPILLLAFLGYSLTQLGWRHVWDARPTAFSFYFVLLLPFFVQPVADLIIYRNLLGVGRSLPLSILLRKRYMNSIMLDYSGEAYFFFWARKNLDLKKGVLLHAVKDTNVLSAGAGLAMVWLMLLALVASGVMKLPTFLPANLWTLVMVGSLPLVLCIALIMGGRRVTVLSRGDVATTFAIHLVRSVTALALEFALWWLSGALPSATVCLEFIALRLLITRLPLVPNKELVFVGVGIAAAGLLDVSAPRVAAVLVIMTTVSLLQEFALVGLPWLLEQFQIRHRVDQTAS